MDITLNENEVLASTCWDQKYQLLTIDMTKDKFIGKYWLGLDSLFVSQTNPFKIS